MKKFQIFVNNQPEHVIDLPENEAISIHVQNNPIAESPFLKTSIRAEGGRWENQEYFILGWQERPLEFGDSILITYSESSEKSTSFSKFEKHIKAEEECSFCQKKKSEVEVLIQAKMFAFICNECVNICLETINNFKKT